eukprot:CAMPEP_0185773672 /NCGR_PEP_ID=MMETSP1174-20130828/74613_1 /TAXON_ID=35687 /ORGANISM="Dictyocha speculum, Strain CCMP1381" /LENGTH=162 /DNA_ID=CAMNT_0028460461 /DNA_START=12 /DNA_END=500 /DNA_ORIENTATION=+
MARHGRRRATSAKVKIPRAAKNSVKSKYRKPIFSMPAIAEKWNPERSSTQNLSALGLSSNPNFTVGAPGRVTTEIQTPEVDPCELFDIPESSTGGKFEECDANPKRRSRPMLEVEYRYAAALVKKYGQDYSAMSRDMKLNRDQLTKPKLEKLCLRFKAQAGV